MIWPIKILKVEVANSVILIVAAAKSRPQALRLCRGSQLVICDGLWTSRYPLEQDLAQREI
jgi:hypothetical protein